jgi:hypothetical protein
LGQAKPNACGRLISLFFEPFYVVGLQMNLEEIRKLKFYNQITALVQLSQEEKDNLKVWLESGGYYKKAEVKLVNSTSDFVDWCNEQNKETYQGYVEDSNRRVTVLRGDLKDVWKPTLISYTLSQVVILENYTNIYMCVFSPESFGLTVDGLLTFS